jgi:hypothetical protein
MGSVKTRVAVFFIENEFFGRVATRELLLVPVGSPRLLLGKQKTIYISEESKNRFMAIARVLYICTI